MANGVTKKDVDELRQSLAKLMMAMHDLAKNMKVASTGHRNQQQNPASGRCHFVGESSQPPSVHVGSSSSSSEDEDYESWGMKILSTWNYTTKLSSMGM